MESSSSLAHTTIDIYRYDIESIDDMLAQFHSDLNGTHQAHRVERVVRKFTVLAEPEIPFAVAPETVDLQRGLGPLLSQLPGEVRNHIYSYLVSTGDLKFLRASKALYIEGNGIVSKDGIFRVSLGPDDRINYSLPSQRIVDTIRNLDICADLTYFVGWPWVTDGKPDQWLLRAFGEPGRIRGRCSVSIDVGSSTSEELIAHMCMPLRLFSDFTTVIVQVDLRWFREPRTPTILPLDSLSAKVGDIWLEQRETVATSWSVFKYKCYYEHIHLTHNLGEGKLEGMDNGGFRQVFHPRKALERAGNARI